MLHPRRHPLVAFFALAVLSNAAGSAFSILYNNWLIVGHYLTPRQTAAFWQTVWAYNLVAYPVCLAVLASLLLPVARCRRRLVAGQPVSPGVLARCQRRLINLPALQVGLNFLGWIPGAVVFPLGIGLLGGWQDIAAIGWQFAVSFLVSALLTTVQTYFLLEAFLFQYVYPDFFRQDRPAAIEGGVIRITFRQRMILYWVAVALVPLTALLVVELNCTPEHSDWLTDLRRLALGVTAVSVVSSAVIGAITGRTLLSWLTAHAEATEQIAAGNYDHRIEEKRPGEFGRLTDRFNDMAAELARACLMRETFGQMVGPEVRDEMDRYPGLGGEVKEVTVLFIDIRGFSRRSAGEPPERVVELLNRFFTLSFAAVQRHGGHVNKFLGDGLMALFNVPWDCDDHADRARRRGAGPGGPAAAPGRRSEAPGTGPAGGRHRHPHGAGAGRLHRRDVGLGGRPPASAQGVHRHRRDGQPGPAHRAADQAVRRAGPAERGDAPAATRPRAAGVPGAAGVIRLQGAADRASGDRKPTRCNW